MNYFFQEVFLFWFFNLEFNFILKSKEFLILFHISSNYINLGLFVFFQYSVLLIIKQIFCGLFYCFTGFSDSFAGRGSNKKALMNFFLSRNLHWETRVFLWIRFIAHFIDWTMEISSENEIRWLRWITETDEKIVFCSSKCFLLENGVDCNMWQKCQLV